MWEIHAAIMMMIALPLLLVKPVKPRIFELLIFIAMMEGSIQILLPASIFATYKMFTIFLAFYAIIVTLLLGSQRNRRFLLPGILLFSLFVVQTYLSSKLNMSDFKSGISFVRITFISYAFFISYYNYKFTPNRIRSLWTLFRRLLMLQIVASIIKFFVIGTTEKVVGTVSMTGGANATLLTLIGAILFYAMYLNTQKDRRYLWAAGLFLLIGILSMKRAIWFLVPVYIFLTVFTRNSLKEGVLSNVLRFAKLIPLILVLATSVVYVGARLNPTLNPERAIWGSFDWDYLTNYVRMYNYNEYDMRKHGFKMGRMAGLEYTMDQFFNTKIGASNAFFGYGPNKVIGQSHDSPFLRNFGIFSYGSISGISYTFLGVGIIGGIVLLLFYLQFWPRLVHNYRTKNDQGIRYFCLVAFMIIFVFLFDYIVYTRTFIGTFAVNMILFLFISEGLSSHKVENRKVAFESLMFRNTKLLPEEFDEEE